MIIDFKNMEEQILPNFKGGEKAYAVKKFTDDRNMIMHGRLESGASIGLHTHEGNCEMFYIIEGTGKVLMDGEYERVETGVCHYCPKGHTQRLRPCILCCCCRAEVILFSAYIFRLFSVVS